MNEVRPPIAQSCPGKPPPRGDRAPVGIGGPSVQRSVRGIVDLVRVRAVARAADGVQAAAERDHREPAARPRQRRAASPGVRALVVLVHGAQRGPAHAAAAVAADDEQPAVRRRPRRRDASGAGRALRSPSGRCRIVDLDGVHGSRGDRSRR
jgi:hypothetical protein